MAVRVQVGLVLTRNPLILPKMDEFSQAYLDYKEQLETQRPFVESFYFKKGSVLETKWKQAQLLGKLAQPMEPKLQEFKPPQFDTDLKSLNRQLDKRLYLVTKDKEWALPSFELKDNEFLADVG
jgi:hypothetical protein